MQNIKKKTLEHNIFLRTNNHVRFGLVHFSFRSRGYFRIANMIALKDYYRRWREITGRFENSILRH